MKQYNKKGFTLIEILIVIAILGLLASIVLVGLGGARAKARDARRIADLRNVQNALEVYYASTGYYPDVSSWTDLRNELINANIGVNEIPKDPLSPTQNYLYGKDVSPNPQHYVLQAQLEQNNPALGDDADGNVYGVDCGSGANEKNYCVQF